ncbi:hypothetical protein [Hippea sp. KM1]|uniref:hypothetical protein n=1 Tax=Hippea sp. KM1 TaxID=944481 RepID=UPI00046D0E26|nr:hypothetical protein [Hippea sp. KM1]
MEKDLDRFRSFILEGADSQKALEFIKGLGVDRVFEYEQLKIDDVRRIKELSTVHHSDRIGFVIGSVGFDAQNAMLKLTEEPPPLCWFVFYKPDELLDTIYSRCQRVSFKPTAETGLDLGIVDDADRLFGYLFSLKEKDDIIAALESLIRVLIKAGRAEKAERLFEYVKTLREYNLNRNTVLINAFVDVME